MNDALNKFKAEMEKRGLFRKITVAANLIPPPPPPLTPQPPYPIPTWPQKKP